ncbi:MAG TPA: type II secretion system F family protein [Candidatus Limnocylindrales bacterium]|nr:type II secretion system F family protein [Candidatus Limnocylindrales bacterium]
MLVTIAFTFLAVLMMAWTAGMLLGSRKPADLSHRLEQISRRHQEPAVIYDQDLLRDEGLSSVPLLNRLLRRYSWSAALQSLLTQAGWNIKPAKLVLLSAVLSLTFFLLSWTMLPFLAAAILIGISAGLAPLFLALFKRARRFSGFQRSFPEAIDLLNRAVRAGHAFTSGLELIANELSDPVASEFRTTFDEHNFGLPLRDALFHLAERVPLAEVRFFVTAMLVHQESGGNLAELLENLSAVIRERFKILGEVRIRTAQGRLTAVILMGLPPLLLILLRFLNPDYVMLLFNDPLGQKMLAAACSLQAIGSVVLWRVVHIDV